MKITKRQLRRIIREETRRFGEGCGDVSGPHLEPEHWDISPNPGFGNAPCPHEIAVAIKESGASDADILSWLNALTADLAAQPGAEEEGISFAGNVAVLPGDKAFGMGYEAGHLGLE